MLIFGMGVYELFVNTIGLQGKDDDSPIVKKKTYTGSNLFGLFRLQVLLLFATSLNSTSINIITK